MRPGETPNRKQPSIHFNPIIFAVLVYAPGQDVVSNHLPLEFSSSMASSSNATRAKSPDPKVHRTESSERRVQGFGREYQTPRARHPPKIPAQNPTPTQRIPLAAKGHVFDVDESILTTVDLHLLSSSTTRPNKVQTFFGIGLIYKAKKFKILPLAI